jgi:hypothetical protein
MPPHDDVRDELQRLGAERQELLEQLEDVSGQLHAAIRRANGERVAVVEIARLGRISRQTVWGVLRGGG